MAGKVSLAGPNPLAPGPRSERFAQLNAAKNVSVLFCFFANTLELFLKASQIFVGKFFQIDKFVSSARIITSGSLCQHDWPPNDGK